MTHFTINRFDRATIRLIEGKITCALDDIGKEFGVDIRLSPGGTFTDTSFTGRFEAKIVDAVTGKPAPDPMLKMMCDRHGLDPDKTSRDGFRLTGYKPSRPKFPWSIEDRMGSARKATHGWVMARFAKTTPSAGVATTGGPHTGGRGVPEHPSNAGKYEASF